NALAYPALGLMILTLLLAYSRGGLLALLIGLGVWFALVPLRLRGAAVLATSATGALLIVTVALLLAAGLAIGFAAARRAPRSDVRRVAGVAILVALALVPAVAA